MKEEVIKLFAALDSWFDECFEDLYPSDCYFIDQIKNEWRRCVEGKQKENRSIKCILYCYSQLSAQTPAMLSAYNSLREKWQKNEIKKKECCKTEERGLQLSLF